MSKLTVCVQGFGNVGYHATKFLSEQDGAKIITVSEYDGFIHNKDGINIEALRQHQIDTGSILGFPGAQTSTDVECGIKSECDILIPAAMENAITLENAGDIKAFLVVEAANGPISAEAEKILFANETSSTYSKI